MPVNADGRLYTMTKIVACHNDSNKTIKFYTNRTITTTDDTMLEQFIHSTNIHIIEVSQVNKVLECIIKGCLKSTNQIEDILNNHYRYWRVSGTGV